MLLITTYAQLAQPPRTELFTTCCGAAEGQVQILGGEPDVLPGSGRFVPGSARRRKNPMANQSACQAGCQKIEQGHVWMRAGGNKRRARPMRAWQFSKSACTHIGGVAPGLPNLCSCHVRHGRLLPAGGPRVCSSARPHAVPIQTEARQVLAQAVGIVGLALLRATWQTACARHPTGRRCAADLDDRFQLAMVEPVERIRRPVGSTRSIRPRLHRTAGLLAPPDQHGASGGRPLRRHAPPEARVASVAIG